LQKDPNLIFLPLRAPSSLPYGKKKKKKGIAPEPPSFPFSLFSPTMLL
jgi:hypothetical protein